MTTPDESWVDSIFDSALSHALASGQFEHVNGHEPKSAPGNGLTCSLWVQYIGPAAGDAGSGLAATTALLVLQQRIYTPMVMRPEDAIDPNVLKAVSSLMRVYTGDFDFDGTIRCIDLLGQTGRQLEAVAGYLEIDAKMYRVMTITIPCIVNDVWTQGS